MSVFKTLSEINVNDHVDQKGRFKYLSWTRAVAELRKVSPTATWEVIKFNGLPFCETKTGFFVEVAVTVEGITLSQIHPVLDNLNKTIPVPSAFQINTSIQRCLVKAIALHGLGLYIYAGEDLPDSESEPQAIKQSPAPNLQPPPLDFNDVTSAINAIIDAPDMDTLKGIFGSAYKRANESQRTELMDAYNIKKSTLEKAAYNEFS